MLSASERDLLEQATQAYERHLPEVEEYLEGRGIPLEVARTYRLGCVAEPTPGFGDDEYVGRLTIPYITPAGVVDIRYRALTDGGPKYLSRVGAKSKMFNTRAFRKVSRAILVCEGELDTVIADGLAGVPAVGVPGASNWHKHYPLLFEGYQRVFVMADGDQAGRDFGKKVVSTLDNAVVVTMPDGMDVNDVFQREGAAGIRRRVGISE